MKPEDSLRLHQKGNEIESNLTRRAAGMAGNSSLNS
jgi:hypothetical protein